ncbi:hypothetical protein RM844_20995 [Streptomyces sp. DSM 44915]|uniref:Uncharacterized protein n=1 Tax=Streptomyces chisholmiae TaxID=3075540 RepID=A0ABU2JVI1_9ACTN|nr:hypothetical protein [Streptomyces sp. DSM 44915]MDT0268768.1 hypothetical protein [Streptomyces sp. DSM 44915]
MSLTVDVLTIDPDGTWHLQATPAGCSDLAGPESWRTTVWGSPTVHALGARFFPQLAHGDLIVPPDQVPDFLRECALLRTALDSITPTPDGRSAPLVAERLTTIELAATRALHTGAGLVLW